jgi:hypothetical protein
MGTNVFAPNGLTVGGTRQRAGGAASYQHTPGFILSGYSSKIGRGDLISFDSGNANGTIILTAHSDTVATGVFGAVYPYYDQTLQATAHGLNGSYPATANPVSGQNVPCWFIDDPFVTFIAQVSGGPFAQAWVGKNINFLTGTNGAPDISGQSTLALDGGSVATTNTLPFQIVGVVGVSGGPQDPANTNPWIEVRLNTATLLNTTGR